MILCKLFGHAIPRDGHYIGQPYVKRGRSRSVDGIGRIHQSLMVDCARCNETFEFGMIHDNPAPGRTVKKVAGYYEETTNE